MAAMQAALGAMSARRRHLPCKGDARPTMVAWEPCFPLKRLGLPHDASVAGSHLVDDGPRPLVGALRPQGLRHMAVVPNFGQLSRFLTLFFPGAEKQKASPREAGLSA